MQPWEIDAAAKQAFIDASEFDLPTAYPGFPLKDKPQKTPWAELHFIPVSRDQRLQTVDRITTLMQVDLSYPQGRGTRALGEKTAEVLEYFRPHRRFLYGTEGITVVSAQESAIRHGTGWMVQSITVTLRATDDRSFE